MYERHLPIELRTDPMNGDRSDKFTAAPGSVVFSQCAYCKHLAPSAWAAGCKAFPGGVPDEVLTNELDHRKPIEGDDGVRFEPRPDVAPTVLASLYRTLDALAGRG